MVVNANYDHDNGYVNRRLQAFPPWTQRPGKIQLLEPQI